MKLSIKVIKEVDAKYIQVNTAIRYWHYTEVNGEYDINFMETKGEGEPNIPCAVKVKDEPETHICSDHWHWKPLINIETGQIENWKKGVTGNVLYKVCDEFACDVLDGEKNVVHSYEGYVPDFMCPREAGYGDYIDMWIDEEGFIEDWDKSEVEEFFNAEDEE
ncbi:MAG: hypothetical protein IKU25_00365 [Clostridia bacterium]|nr:hypothetical protein [Clostridia bacterium]